MLRELADLVPVWESEQQSREHSRGLGQHSTTMPPPERLPFNLDSTLDDDTHTRTYRGACRLLGSLREEWERAAGMIPFQAWTPDPVGDVTKMVACAGAVWDKSETTYWNEFVTRLERLRDDARAHTGRCPKPVGLPCLECGHLLEQPYSDDGLIYVWVCPACGWWDNPDNYHDIAIAHARYTDIDAVVTMSQAARILNVDLSVVKMRARRRELHPVAGLGRGALYRLADLKTT